MSQHILARTLACLSSFCLCGVAALADQAAKPDMSGTWQLDPAQSEMHSHPSGDSTWIISQKDDSIHIQEGNSSLDCTTRGKDCSVKYDGKPAKVSFWYNGSALVEMETLGHGGEFVTKKRMLLSPDGSVLTVELVHILPNSAPEKLVLKKQK